MPKRIRGISRMAFHYTFYLWVHDLLMSWRRPWVKMVESCKCVSGIWPVFNYDSRERKQKNAQGRPCKVPAEVPRRESNQVSLGRSNISISIPFQHIPQRERRRIDRWPTRYTQQWKPSQQSPEKQVLYSETKSPRFLVVEILTAAAWCVCFLPHV